MTGSVQDGDLAKSGAAHLEKEELPTKNQGQDDVLEFLRGGAEEFSEEEAKAVLKKIDWRLTPVLVLVNCIQLVDKNVRSPSPTVFIADLTDSWFRSHLWPHSTSQPSRISIQYAGHALLHRIHGCRIPIQLSHAEIPHWKVSDHQFYTLGYEGTL